MLDRAAKTTLLINPFFLKEHQFRMGLKSPVNRVQQTGILFEDHTQICMVFGVFFFDGISGYYL